MRKGTRWTNIEIVNAKGLEGLFEALFHSIGVGEPDYARRRNPSKSIKMKKKKKKKKETGKG